MHVRIARPLVVLVLITGLWALSQTRSDVGRGWVHTAGAAARPVKILRFYSTTGYLKAGEQAKLCYSVENAKMVRIAPMMGRVFPSSNRCLSVVPSHTTHYTILAEGFDGQVVMRSLTLAVVAAPATTDPFHDAEEIPEHAVAKPNA
jgi:hypothetical protein